MKKRSVHNGNGGLTLDGLARMMADGLKEVGEKVDDAKEEVKTEIKGEIDIFKSEVNSRFNRLENSFEKSEDEHYELSNTNAKNEREIGKLRRRVSALELKVMKKI